jgi:hypothetical protein
MVPGWCHTLVADKVVPICTDNFTLSRERPEMVLMIITVIMI